MIKESKHYRCKSCRSVAVVKRDTECQMVHCPKCNTLFDEHDEIVRLVRTKFHRQIKVC